MPAPVSQWTVPRGSSGGAWAVLSLIPVVNFIFMYYVIYQVIYGVLDRLPPHQDQV
ncbi:MAG TPA: hypothetical protein VM689_03080 [Aliidongia sp.]|nr:hypothetical protein [Aliidongia sp.]